MYSYDAEDKLTKKRIVPADGSERVVYYENSDDSNIVAKLSVGGRTVTSHSKTDSFGRKAFDELQLGTGFVSRQFHYHSGAVTEEHIDNNMLKSSPTTQLVSQIVLSGGRTISYEYDAEERITKVTDSVDGVTEYTYDALGQLLTEKHDGTAVNSMEYDNYGNIKSKNGVAYTYGDSAWKDLLTAVGDRTIVYDAQGNPTSYLGHTLTWEKGRQLKSFDNITYTYNANGIRTSKTVDGVKHTYTLDGTKILRETWTENTLVPMYDNEDNVCGIIYNDEPYYFQKNLQGDVIAIINKNAAVVATYSYDAWGTCTVTSDTSGVGIATVNPYRYRCYYYDSEIQMYYLQSRYYDPSVGRFINADAQFDICVIGYNLFAYCKNSSLMSIDSDGRRTYFINGINNDSSTGVPSYAKDFAGKLTKLGVKDVRNIGIFRGKAGFVGTVKGVAKVVLEMFNVDIYTKMVLNIINKDLKSKRLAKGEQLNLIGYSGGGQIVMNVMVKMNGKITNAVLIGAPLLKSWKCQTKVSIIYAGWDPLSWNIGWGFKAYFAGWFGHTSYFSSKNIDKVANIVNKIID